MIQSSILVLDPILHQENYVKSTINWWKWLLSIPKFMNPAFDRDGSSAHILQNDPELFFLCQTFESKNYIPRRSVKVPRGKRIFMPIINWISVRDCNQTDEELIRLANERMDQVGKLEVYVNGRQIIDNFQRFRVQSPVFELELCHDNILDIQPQDTRMISDGYWIMLEPICRQIILNSFGACSSGATHISVCYQMEIDTG